MASEKAFKRFAKAVKDSGGAERVAFSLDCSRATVDYLMEGERNPGLEIAWKIEQLYGIRMQDWVDDVVVTNDRIKRAL